MKKNKLFFYYVILRVQGSPNKSSPFGDKINSFFIFLFKDIISLKFNFIVVGDTD